MKIVYWEYIDGTAANVKLVVKKETVIISGTAANAIFVTKSARSDTSDRAVNVEFVARKSMAIITIKMVVSVSCATPFDQ